MQNTKTLAVLVVFCFPLLPSSVLCTELAPLPPFSPGPILTFVATNKGEGAAVVDSFLGFACEENRPSNRVQVSRLRLSPAQYVLRGS